MKKIAHFIASFLMVVSILAPVMVSAQDEFDYDFIISDQELLSYQTMTAQQIQHFLDSKKGYIANYFFQVDAWYAEHYPSLPYPDGSRISAAEHIYNAAQKHKVNPKFLLAMLQKEQGLVDDSAPKVSQLDWAMGYGCFDNQPCNERWRGFQKQVNSTAEQFRYYYEHIGEYNVRPGAPATIDGVTIMPKNIVTAALYNYTPHLHGNKLFRTIWEQYFLQAIPDGTLVQVPGDAGVWLIKNNERRAFTSELALVSRYNPDLIVPISATDLEQYSRGTDIIFPAYSLLRNSSNDMMYLLTIDKKRLISSMDVFRGLGFNPEEVEDATDSQLSEIPDGAPITLGDSYPTGAILQDETTGKLYFVETGRKYPLLSKEIASINFPTLTPVVVSSNELNNYSSGFPVKLRDGSIVKGSGPEVYVISNGLKRHIDSEEAFNSIGYKWANIKVVSDDILAWHSLGKPITVNP